MRLRRQLTTRDDTTPSSAEKRRRRLWIAADIAAVAVIGSLGWRWMNVMPNVTIPAPPPLPSPNAFDTFTQASSLIVEEKTVGWASTRSLPPARNGVPYSDAEKTAAVAANAKALALLRSGFSQQYQNPTRRTFDAKFNELARFRDMARLLSLEGQVRETSGDFGGAAESRLDAMRLGIEIPRGGNLIHLLVGIACEAIGRRPLWALADKLSADEARSAAKRLEEMNARRVPAADPVQEEKWAGQAAVQKILPRSVALSSSPPFLKTKSGVIADHSAYMDAVLARVRLPYAVAARVAPPRVPNDRINAIICPNFEGVRIKEADTRMQNSLLIAVLALQAYRAEHNGYPEDLAALVRGRYLTKVPADPFSSTGDGPLRYRRLENGKYLLYSIGPDCVDDDGTPIQARRSGGRAKYWVEADMKGDYVVGVNNIQTEKSPRS